MATSPENWIAKQTFKKLAADLRASEGRSFEGAALPYLRLAFGDVRQAIPALDHHGIDLVRGEESPFALVVQCKSSVQRISLPEHLFEARKSIRAFEIVAAEATATSSCSTGRRRPLSIVRRSSRIAGSSNGSGSCRRQTSGDLLNAAFNAMQERVETWG